MKLSKLFKKLREFAVNTVDLQLNQFKKLITIFYESLSPTEKEICYTDYINAMSIQNKQISLTKLLELKISET